MRIQKYPKPYLSNRDPGNRECESHSELAEIRSLQAAWWYLHPKKLQGPWQERGRGKGGRVNGWPGCHLFGYQRVVRVVRPWCDVCVASSYYMRVTHYGI